MDYKCNACGHAECVMHISEDAFARNVVLKNIRCPFLPLGMSKDGFRQDEWSAPILENYINDEAETCRFCKHWNLIYGENGGEGNCALHPTLKTDNGDNTWPEYAHRCADFEEDAANA